MNRGQPACGLLCSYFSEKGGDVGIPIVPGREQEAVRGSLFWELLRALCWDGLTSVGERDRGHMWVG